MPTESFVKEAATLMELRAALEDWLDTVKTKCPEGASVGMSFSFIGEDGSVSDFADSTHPPAVIVSMLEASVARVTDQLARMGITP